MRPSLRHAIGERRHVRRIHGAHRSPVAPEPNRSSGGEAAAWSDQASYACPCGYLFAAAVTTTVRCPHCGSEQAW
jgi:hypothetical protein